MDLSRWATDIPLHNCCHKTVHRFRPSKSHVSCTFPFFRLKETEYEKGSTTHCPDLSSSGQANEWINSSEWLSFCLRSGHKDTWCRKNTFTSWALWDLCTRGRKRDKRAESKTQREREGGKERASEREREREKERKVKGTHSGSCTACWPGWCRRDWDARADLFPVGCWRRRLCAGRSCRRRCLARTCCARSAWCSRNHKSRPESSPHSGTACWSCTPVLKETRH